MATCANCGSENPDESRFCGNCGQALQAAEPVEATPPEDQSAAPTTEQPAGYTPEHAAYNEALAAINAPGAGAPTAEQPPATTEQPAATTEQPAATTPQPPVTTVPPVAPTPAPMAAPPTSSMPPDMAAAGGGSNKKVLAIVGGVVGLLVILAAVWFFFLRQDETKPVAKDLGTVEEDAEESTEEEVNDDASDVPIEGGDGPVFDSLAALLVDSAGPYSITQQSSEPCEPPCIFPDDAHLGSLETAQATWDAGSPESQIYGEFLLYEDSTQAGTAFQTTASQLEASGYEPIGSVTIQDIEGTTYQSAENEVILYTAGNMMMGLVGNMGFPTEFVGYL